MDRPVRRAAEEGNSGLEQHSGESSADPQRAAEDDEPDARLDRSAEGTMKVHQLDQSVIIDPETGSPAHALVLYGGLFGWEGGWFLNEIPGYMKEATVFCLPKHYTNSCQKCLDELHSKVSPDSIRSYSLAGYSRGGIEVYRYRGLKEW